MNIKVNGNSVIRYNNSDYVKIFRHDIRKARFFNDANECRRSFAKNRFSTIGYIDETFKINDRYHFLIVYEEIDAYLEWNQEISMLERVESVNAEIYNNSFNEFHGLAVSTDSSNTCFDGTPMTLSFINWWYAIGVMKREFFKIPGPVFDDRINVNAVELYIKFNDIQQIAKLPILKDVCTNRCRTRGYSFLSLVSFLILLK